MKALKIVLTVALVLLFFAGLGWALYPTVNGYALTQNAHKDTVRFEARRDFVEAITPSEGDEAEERPYNALWEAMLAYNEQIYLEKQEGLCDAWAYQQPSFDLADYGISDGIIGVISIPKLDIELPIYLGASYDNMARGAVHLSQTSLPIGGENTNCVIAAHRGWAGADYFRHIDRLQPGDIVIVTNPWNTLRYEVNEVKIIAPDAVDEILIREGEDMLTLLTCHPYLSGGKQRYVVYCKRCE